MKNIFKVGSTILLTSVIFLTCSCNDEKTLYKKSSIQKGDDSVLLNKTFTDAYLDNFLNLNLLEKNSVFSPVTAFQSLVGISNLGNDTLKNMISAKFGVSSNNDFNSLSQKALVKLTENNCKLNNSIWLDDSANYNDEIINNLASKFNYDSYYGDLDSKDMKKDMTNWMNDKLDEKLKITDVANIDEETAFMMLNTCYYEYSYKEKTTTSHPFYGDAETNIPFVSFKSYKYIVNESYIAAEISDPSSKVIIPLKDEVLNYSQIYKDLDSMEYLDAYDVYIPLFKVSTKKMNLIENGYNGLFTKQEMNMITNKESLTGLSNLETNITGIDQTNILELTTKGIKGKSVTATKGEGSVGPAQNEIWCDQPFYFILEHQSLPIFEAFLTF